MARATTAPITLTIILKLSCPPCLVASMIVTRRDTSLTWTPTLTTTGVNFSSVTYDAVTAGKYTKIGRVVFVEGKLRTDAVTVGSATGTVLIGGFPFTAGAAPNGCLAIGGLTQSWNAQNPLHLTMIAATTTAQLYHRTAVTGGTVANTVAGVNTGADQNETAFGGYYFV